jgi:hypothetical protein
MRAPMREIEAPGPSIWVQEPALAAGFSNSPIGTHTGKTMMLSELRHLLAAVPARAHYADYERAATLENALGKSTAANRSNTVKYLKQLYALRPDVPVFSAMRELWDSRYDDQPMLALLCAAARDVLLRTTAHVVLTTQMGAPLTAAQLTAAILGQFPDRYSPASLRNLGQNIASSWTQAGLLEGSQNKRRSKPSVGMAALVYAMYLGHLEGTAGPALFTTRWAGLLDRQASELRAYAELAARNGWIEYKSSGGMTEITFRHLDDLTGWTGS